MSERLLAVLLQQALLLSVGVVLIAALRPLLLKRLGAGSVYAAWLLVPALLLTPLLPRPAQEPLRVVLQATGTSTAAAAPALPAPPPDQAATWLALWLGGAILVAAVQAKRQWRLARLGERLPAGSSPALVGLLRPRVALPADFEERFSSDERELILAHEQVHRDRQDNLWNLLACALTALHWWNPLAWLAARRMQADQELACDAVVLQGRPEALATYTRALLAAHGLTTHGAPLASRWTSTHPLIERIALMNHPQRLTRRRTALLGAALMGAVSLAWAAQTEHAAITTTGATQRVLIDTEITTTGAPQRFLFDTEVQIGPHADSPRLLAPLGVPVTIGIDHGDGSGAWQVVMTVTQDSDGQLRILSEHSQGEPLTKAGGSHTQVAPAGTPIDIRWTAPDGSSTLAIKRVVTLVPDDARAGLPLNPALGNSPVQTSPLRIPGSPPTL